MPATNPTTSRPENRPQDNQERRLRLKREAIVLAAHLASYGARVDLGRITPHHATVEVRQQSRQRQDVTVVIDDDAPLFSVTSLGRTTEFHDVDSVRRRVVAPPPRWTKLWFGAVTLVAWVLAAIGAAIFTESTHWLVLAAIVVAGCILTVAVGVLVARGRRAGTRRRTAARLSGRR